MMPEDFTSDRSFLTPAFDLLIDGQPAGRRMMADILDLSFTDDLAAINAFEFTIYDWDPARLEPVYSFPWDANGNARQYWDSDEVVPDVQPGAKLTLHLGYQDEGALPLIMEGEVISIATSFPSSGLPVAKVRVQDAFLRGLQKTWVQGSYDGTPKAIVDTLCVEAGVTVRWDTIDSEGDAEERVAVDGPLFDEIEKRVRDYGLSMITERGAAGPSLYLARPTPFDAEPVAVFEWGRTLVDFAPTLSAAGQIGTVEGRGADTNADTGEQALVVEHTWDSSTLELDPEAFGGAATFDLDRLMGTSREVIKPDDGTTLAKVEAAVEKRFREMAETLITGTGNSVGLPELRAGALVRLEKMGALYSGLYRITQATHKFGAAGYTTSFAATKKVLK